jgi:hypothetical protein
LNLWHIIAWNAVLLHLATFLRLRRHWGASWFPFFKWFLLLEVPSCALFNIEQSYDLHLWRWLAAPLTVLIAAITIESSLTLLYGIWPSIARWWRLGQAIGVGFMWLPGSFLIAPWLNFPPWLFRARLRLCILGIALCFITAIGTWWVRVRNPMRPIFYWHAVILGLYLSCIVWGMTRPLGTKSEWQIHDAIAQTGRTICLAGWLMLFRPDARRESTVLRVERLPPLLR